jgi:hypothetical protein
VVPKAIKVGFTANIFIALDAGFMAYKKGLLGSTLFDYLFTPRRTHNRIRA